MNNQPMLLLWLQENIQRLFSSSPVFFKVWQIISTVVLLVTGVPELLAYFNVLLPEPFNTFESKTVAIAAAVGLFMSSLTAQSKPVDTTHTGDVIKKVNKKQLPFTNESDKKTLKK